LTALGGGRRKKKKVGPAVPSEKRGLGVRKFSTRSLAPSLQLLRKRAHYFRPEPGKEGEERTTVNGYKGKRGGRKGRKLQKTTTHLERRSCAVDLHKRKKGRSIDRG